MLTTSLIFFVLAAMLGMYLLSLVLTDKPIKKEAAITHGLFAAVGLALLLIYPFYYKPSPVVSTVLLICAALGGLTMMYKGISGKAIPKWLALGHGTLALIGLGTLIVFILID